MWIIGCGYIGRTLGTSYLLDGIPVTGVVATARSKGQLEKIGITGLVRDLDLDQVQDFSPTGLFYFAPPPADGTGDPRLRTFLANLESGGPAPRIVYISTTGVYGDCGGDWVDETRPPEPTTDRAHRRLDAELALLDWSDSCGGEVVILRVAGIYGPGRLPLDSLQQGRPVLRAADAPWSNRIHAADLVTVCRAAMDRGKARTIYNVSDGHPGTMTEYFQTLADLAGLDRPPQLTSAQAEKELSPQMMSFLRESRRLDNRKMLEELEVDLKYPTVQEGLRASL